MTGKLIDAEKLKKHYAWWDDDERRALFDQIVDAQPTVDAVPVIRCKDCKHRVLINHVWRCLYSDFIVPEHYCGYAERKE